jgi:Polyprenyl synthetase
MNKAFSFEDWVRAHGQRTELALDNLLDAVNTNPARLHEAMRYAAQGGGKRIRPLLVYAAGALSDDANQNALDAAAVAIECIHAYSLVHDDLPCMDDDDLRRGRPTVHKAYDEATALLVGDALQTRAFEILANIGWRLWLAGNGRRTGDRFGERGKEIRFSWLKANACDENRSVALVFGGDGGYCRQTQFHSNAASPKLRPSLRFSLSDCG